MTMLADSAIVCIKYAVDFPVACHVCTQRFWSCRMEANAFKVTPVTPLTGHFHLSYPLVLSLVLPESVFSD